MRQAPSACPFVVTVRAVVINLSRVSEGFSHQVYLRKPNAHAAFSAVRPRQLQQNRMLTSPVPPITQVNEGGGGA